MADNVDDNNYIIPYLTGNHTFADWASHYNTTVINKLNLGKIYNGVSGDGIVFTLGTTAAADPLGGDLTSINEGDLIAGTFRCSIADRIPKGITFNEDVSILGELKYDLSKLESPAINVRVNSTQGFTGIKGFNFGNPIRVKTANTAGEEGCTGPPNYYLGKANNSEFAEVMGVVRGVTWPYDSSGNPKAPYDDTNTYLDVVLSGRIKGNFGQGLFADGVNASDSWGEGLTATGWSGGGLTAGEIYFLSPGTSGGITPVEPTVGGQVSKPVIMGITGDEGIVLNYRGQFLKGSGTGGTGGINDNRFWIAPDNTDLVRGVVARFDGTNWKKAFAPSELSDSVGLVTDRVNLDGTDFVEIVTTGHLNNIPVKEGASGLVYIGPEGQLVDEVPSGAQKPFAVVWPDGSDQRRGVIVNQNHAGGGGAAGAYWDGGAGQYNNTPLNWAVRSSTSGGATYGAAINENIMVNGGFDIWQRSIGKDSSYGATGSTYFADSWVRIDGVSGAGGIPGTYSLQRQEFAKNQIDVFGNPKYYLSSKHVIAGTGGHHGDRIVIQNRINDARTARGQDVTLSFSAKCGITGATMGIVVNQYDGTNSHTQDVASASLGTIWGKHEVSFTMPNLNVSPTQEHYVGVGFDVTRLAPQNTTFDLAKVKLERGLVATVNPPSDVAKELEKCSEFYQRTYNVDENTHSVTMLDDNNPTLTVLDITTTPMKDYYHRFPVRMNSIPDVTFFSPKTGTTADAYNRTAEKDLRYTSGTNSSYGTRSSSTGARTIIAEHKTRDGLYIVIPEGTVLWDQVSAHYVADADLNEDMPNA